MALSTEDAAWLAELRVARAKLIKGQRVASVSSGGRSIAFTGLAPEAALARIEDEIALLEAADAGDGVVRRRGALRFRV